MNNILSVDIRNVKGMSNPACIKPRSIPPIPLNRLQALGITFSKFNG